jgi:hypothetical protein
MQVLQNYINDNAGKRGVDHQWLYKSTFDVIYKYIGHQNKELREETNKML